MKYQIENAGNSLLFRCRVHENGWNMPPHLHEFSEIIYCRSGSGYIVVNGNKISLGEKQLAFIPPHHIHEYYLKNTETVCAVFSNDFIPLFFHELENHTLIVSPINMSDMADTLDHLDRLAIENNLTISGYLNLICGKVIAQSKLEEAINIDTHILQKIILYIAKNYTDNIHLSDIAKKFGYNEKYLSSQLHRITKFNFTSFLSLFRIEHSKMLLSTQNAKSIATIAGESGFDSIKTFNRVFKSNTGLTPLEYKKKVNTSLHT